MTITIAPGETAQDVRAAITPIWHYFGFVPTEEAVSDFTQLMTPGRALVARDGDVLAGGCGSFPFTLTTPGGHVKAAGLSVVGVLPTHRRKGILSGLMRRFLDDCRSRDEPVAYLWASEEPIYGRFGFGVTALSADIHVARDRSRMLANPRGDIRARMVPLAGAHEVLAPIYDKVAAITPGAFARTEDWWRRKVLTDPPWQRKDGGFKQCVVIELDGAPAAYAFYRIFSQVERGVPQGGVEVIETVAVSPDATVALWRFLFDIDLSSWFKASFLPLDHPLVLLAAEARRLNFRQRDGTWLRFIDLETALSARAYGSGAEIVIEVEDTLCPWNTGRWLIEIGGVRRTTQDADLRCGVDALASAYLGGFSWRQIVASSRAAARDEDAIRRADRVFERRAAPWCPEIF